VEEVETSATISMGHRKKWGFLIDYNLGNSLGRQRLLIVFMHSLFV